MNTRMRLGQYFRAGYAGIFLQSYEEKRVEAELQAVANDIGYTLFTWTVTDSLVGPIGKLDEDGKPVKPMTYLSDDGQPLGPIEVLDRMIPKDNKPCLPEKSIILAKDYQLFTGEPNPVLIRKVKDALEVGRMTARRFVILGCAFSLTKELEKEFTPVEFALPDREELKKTLTEIAESAGIALNGNTDKILDAGCGMTTTEAADAFALAVIESGGQEIGPTVVAREKAQTVKKSGLLEIMDAKETLSDVGGNQGIKDWISTRKRAFTKEAKAFGLPIPRGLLLAGISGCGKSQFAKVIANVLDVPLIRLDAGKIFGSLVGQSEANLRLVIQTVEAVAPCCLMVDEIEKGMAGSESSGQTDGGTSARVFGTFLSWMNDKTAPVFVVATANNISKLPPEFLRKGRFDEIFFVDLPDDDERADIFKIHLAKRNRKPDAFDIQEVAKATQGFTGAEIESIVVESLFLAFDKERELLTEDLMEAITRTVPLSRTMATQVAALQQWANGRARRASAPAPQELKKGRKLS